MTNLLFCRKYKRIGLRHKMQDKFWEEMLADLQFLIEGCLIFRRDAALLVCIFRLVCAHGEHLERRDREECERNSGNGRIQWVMA